MNAHRSAQFCSRWPPPRRTTAMYVGTQIEPRDDSDYQVWAQLRVTHVCVDPPGSADEWNLDALRRHKDHIESFGLSLDMVQLPISSGPLEAEDKAQALLADGQRTRCGP